LLDTAAGKKLVGSGEMMHIPVMLRDCMDDKPTEEEAVEE